MIPVLVTEADPVTSDFTVFGRYWLTDCISCTVTEERNGLFDCQIVYPINGANYDQIEDGTIVLCPHDNTLARQPFFVYRREPNLDGTTTLYLHHISYALNYIVTDNLPANTTDALSSIFDGIKNTASPYRNSFSALWPDDIGLYTFSADDDTEQVNGFAAALTYARSVRDLLLGSSGSVLSILQHGEFEWDRYNVLFHNGPNGRGSDNGVAIRYGGTLTEAQQVVDTEAAHNGVVPYWIDKSTGTVRKLSTQGGRTVSVDEDPPSEPGHFPGRYSRRLVPLDVSQVFEDEPTTAQLTTYCEQVLTDTQPWQQYDNITIQFVTQDTDNADDYAELQGVRLCDTIHVSIAPFQSEYTAKIIKTVYNVLLERYDSVEIGQPQTTLSDIYGGTATASSGTSSPAFDPTQYYTKTETDDLLADGLAAYYTKSETDDLLDDLLDDCVKNGTTDPVALGGNVAITGTDALFKVVELTASASGSSSSRNVSLNQAVSPGAGWTPIGIVGAYSSMTTFYIYRAYLNEGNAIIGARYTGDSSSSTSVTLRAYVLCLRTAL